MTYSEVFKRVEKKYRIDAHQRRMIELLLTRFMKVDAFGETRITSLYLDTPSREVIERSLEKPLYKEKLRLRAYGEANGQALVAAFAANAQKSAGWQACRRGSRVECRAEGLAAPCAGLGAGSNAVRQTESPAAPCAEDARCRVGCLAASAPVFFELKKKYKGVVYKRRVGMSLPAACDYLAGAPFEVACAQHPFVTEASGNVPLTPTGRQIGREIDAACRRHANLAPAMAIACNRVAWEPRESCNSEVADLRVTLDGALSFLDFSQIVQGRHARGAATGKWQGVIGPDESIMEVKSAGHLPLWLADALAQVGAYPTSFSKYGTAHRMSAGASGTASCPARESDSGAASRSARTGAPGAAPRSSAGVGAAPRSASGAGTARSAAAIRNVVDKKGDRCA